MGSNLKVDSIYILWIWHLACRAALAERLRRQPAKLMGKPARVRISQAAITLHVPNFFLWFCCTVPSDLRARFPSNFLSFVVLSHPTPQHGFHPLWLLLALCTLITITSIPITLTLISILITLITLITPHGFRCTVPLVSHVCLLLNLGLAPT